MSEPVFLDRHENRQTMKKVVESKWMFVRTLDGMRNNKYRSAEPPLFLRLWLRVGF